MSYQPVLLAVGIIIAISAIGILTVHSYFQHKQIENVKSKLTSKTFNWLAEGESEK
jgi:hypothetical protein